MAVHNWSKTAPCLFHHFHQSWSVELCNALNKGGLPPDYYALLESHAFGVRPDMLPKEEIAAYAIKANRIKIHSTRGEIISVIEIVSPGNKSSAAAVGDFVEKCQRLIQNGVHLLIVDLFPPTPRDPRGLHPLIWDFFHEEPFELTSKAPLCLMSYHAATEITCYLQPISFGAEIPEMPLFLNQNLYVQTPLEMTYEQTWRHCPSIVREAVRS